MNSHSHSHSHDHSHSHSYAHSHTHSHAGHKTSKKQLMWAVAVILFFAIIEAVSGWWAHSLVLLSDAGHMASDALALGIAAFAAWLAGRPPSELHSYGLGRAEVIAAWFSSMMMVVVAVFIFIEAIARLRHPPIVSGAVVMPVALLGLIINLAIFWLLTRGERSLNMRAAILHVIGDLLGSVVALVVGIIVYFTHWTLIDPLLSIFVCLLIVFSSVQLLRESLLILMEGVPTHLDLEEVGQAMAATEHVHAVHDLHIWTLSSGRIMLTAHIQIAEIKNWQPTMVSLRQLLDKEFGINHVTLQPELTTEIVYPLHPFPRA